MSKLSIKQVQDLIRSMNSTMLRQTPYGLGIEKEKNSSNFIVFRRYRRPEEKAMEGKVFEGSIRECAAYLAGTRDALRDWLPMVEVR